MRGEGAGNIYKYKGNIFAMILELFCVYSRSQIVGELNLLLWRLIFHLFMTNLLV